MPNIADPVEIVKSTGLTASLAGALPAGTNNIGKVTLDGAIPAGANTVGNVGLNAGVNNIGDVDLTASELHIGEVGAKTIQVDMIPIITGGGAYISGDYVGESAAYTSIPGCSRVLGGTGVIKSAILIDKAKQSLPLEVWIFDAPFTPPADNAPWSISDADAQGLIGILEFSSYFATALNSISQVHFPLIGFKCKAGVNSLYMAMVTRGAPTYASQELSVKFNIWQD